MSFTWRGCDRGQALSKGRAGTFGVRAGRTSATMSSTDELALMKTLRPPPMPLWRKLLWLGLVAALAVLAARAYVRMIRMPGASRAGPLPALMAADRALSTRLEQHVRVLATDIGGRSTQVPAGLARAALYLEEQLSTAGYDVQRERFDASGVRCDNLIAERRGTTRPRELVVVGAHYDSVRDRPAANDNASGTAALLELARLYATRAGPRTVRFVAFANEEPPHFQRDSMGSLVDARRARGRGDDVVAMVSLETIGYFDEREGSQHYPFPLSVFYPDRGDFVAFVTRVEDRALVRRAIGSFRRAATLPSQGAALSSSITGVDFSDHWSFWQAGYPALMVTDSAFFRDSSYHTVRDTPEHLDYGRMARLVRGLVAVIDDLRTVARADIATD